MKTRNPRLTELILRELAANELITQKEIASRLHCSKFAVCKRIKHLIDDKLIVEDNLGIIKNYRLTPQGETRVALSLSGGGDSATQTSSGGQNFVYPHNFEVKCVILKKPYGWDGLLADGNVWRTVVRRGWKGKQRRMEGVTVEITPKNVLFYVSRFAAAGVGDGRARIQAVVNDCKRKLEDEYRGLILDKPESEYFKLGTVSRQEWGIPDDPYARKVVAAGLPLPFKGKFHHIDTSIKGADGRKKEEVDWTDKRSAGDHCKVYRDFVDDVGSGVIQPKEQLNAMFKNISVIQRSQEELMKAHGDVLNLIAFNISRDKERFNS